MRRNLRPDHAAGYTIAGRSVATRTEIKSLGRWLVKAVAFVLAFWLTAGLVREALWAIFWAKVGR